MRRITFATLTALGGLLAAGMPVQAAPVDNSSLASPGVYYGNGNSGTNTGWVVDTENGVELGVDVITRFQGSVAPAGGGNVYFVPTGDTALPNTGSIWGFAFSAKTTTGLLSGVTLSMTITDSVQGVTTTFDPKTFIGDNSGTDGSTVFGGSKGCSVAPANTSACDPTTQKGIQNAETLSYLQFDPLFNPWIADTYTVTLSASLAGAPLGSVTEVINAVPEPASMALLGSAVAGLGFLRRRRGKAANKG